jgi:hypothetical protein
MWTSRAASVAAALVNLSGDASVAEQVPDRAQPPSVIATVMGY